LPILIAPRIQLAIVFGMPPIHVVIFYGSGVDDEGYLISIIDLVSAKYNVDLKRVYLIGHSNGGFMAR
jgi:poly(3-hydroxybutyrate) depolymerase